MARIGDIIQILAEVLKALRGGKKLAAREREKLHGNALLSFSAVGGDPSLDVLLPLRPRFSCSAREEADMLRWLVEGVILGGCAGCCPGIQCPGCCRIRRDVTEDQKVSEEDFKASRKIGADDKGPIANGPVEVSSVALSRKKKKVLLALMPALG